jgi:hypothetical protein
MKVRLSSLAVMHCFVGKGGALRKKVSGGRIASVGSKGKVSYKKVKGDPEVEPAPCDLRLFGVGYRKNPETVVQIGDGNILRREKRR